jgi:oligopeptide transport system ATP-binding protein
MNEPLISIENLKIYFPQKGKKEHLRAVDGVSFEIGKGETFGLVGESGSGKSTLALSIAGLYKPFGGDIFFKGVSLAGKSGQELRSLRRHMQMVFQDPYGSFNPRRKVGPMLEEAMVVHGLGTKRERAARVAELLEMVGMPPEAARRFPHEFSGGQRQRLGIARALSVNPDFIILDEPVSALDVSMQAQILNLLKELQARLELTYFFIAHDIGVVRHMCDRIGVMYLGRVVELLPDDDIGQNAKHPYTQSLISSIPGLDDENATERFILGGDAPSPINLPSGCRFHERCFKTMAECRSVDPESYEVRDGHNVACLLYKPK